MKHRSGMFCDSPCDVSALEKQTQEVLWSPTGGHCKKFSDNLTICKEIFPVTQPANVHQLVSLLTPTSGFPSDNLWS